MGEMRLAEAPVYNARPTLRVDGTASLRLDALLRTLELREQEGGLSSLELCFVDWASDPGGGATFAFDDERLLKLGARIAAYAGDVAGPQEIFQGRISALQMQRSGDGAPQLVVLAEDALQGARLKRRVKVHEDLSLAALAESIASGLSLAPRITGYSASIGTWVQLNESDLAFLRRLLRRHDGDVQVVGAELHVSPRKDVRRNTVELQYGSQLRRVRVTADLASQATRITVSGWNARDGAVVAAAATTAELGPGRGRTGAALLEESFGPREEHVAHFVAASDGEARALAAALYAERARRFVVVEAEAIGNPALRVGSEVALRGVSPRVDNAYYVVACRHRFDRDGQGYVTEFEAECAYFGAP